jgi:hypothetical protein
MRGNQIKRLEYVARGPPVNNVEALIGNERQRLVIPNNGGATFPVSHTRANPSTKCSNATPTISGAYRIDNPGFASLHATLMCEYGLANPTSAIARPLRIPHGA